MQKNKLSATILLVIAAILVYVSSQSFLGMYEPEPIVVGPGVTDIRMLSDYFPKLKDTPGDTEVYVLEGKKPGGKVLVLGGTHPNEIASLLTAVVLIENAVMEEGTLFVIPRTSNSGFTHNNAQEASPQRVTIKTPFGERWFRYGGRDNNPIHQWPDPDVYIHASSGQKLSGNETRNLNRAYPGKSNGTFTEKVAYGIVQLINKEQIDLTIDLHEAAPEYPVVNAIVAHDRAMPIASQALINMQLAGIDIKLEPSPTGLRGLSHRELGDHTDTFAVLLETANPSQGRLRGKTNEEMALSGKDAMYLKAAELGRLYIDYNETGQSIELRVARHLTGVVELAKALGDNYPEKRAVFSNLPTYNELIENKLGSYLLEVAF